MCVKKYAKIVRVLFLVLPILVGRALCTEPAPVPACDQDALKTVAIQAQDGADGSYWEDLFLAAIVGATLQAGFSKFVQGDGFKDAQLLFLAGVMVALVGRRVVVKLSEKFLPTRAPEDQDIVPQELLEDLVKNNSTDLQEVFDYETK